VPCCILFTIVFAYVESCAVDGDPCCHAEKSFSLCSSHHCNVLFRYNGYMRESAFSVGLQRIATNDIDKVKEIVDATFDNVVE